MLLVLTTCPTSTAGQAGRDSLTELLFWDTGLLSFIRSRGIYNWGMSDTEEHLLVSESSRRMRGATVLGMTWFLFPPLVGHLGAGLRACAVNAAGWRAAPFAMSRGSQGALAVVQTTFLQLFLLSLSPRPTESSQGGSVCSTLITGGFSQHSNSTQIPHHEPLEPRHSHKSSTCPWKGSSSRLQLREKFGTHRTPGQQSAECSNPTAHKFLDATGRGGTVAMLIHPHDGELATYKTCPQFSPRKSILSAGCWRHSA